MYFLNGELELLTSHLLDGTLAFACLSNSRKDRSIFMSVVVTDMWVLLRTAFIISVCLKASFPFRPSIENCHATSEATTFPNTRRTVSEPLNPPANASFFTWNENDTHVTKSI